MDSANFLCRMPFLTGWSRSRLLRHGVSTLAVALSVFLLDSHLKPPAVADDLADFQKRQLYDFEQCAGSCQVELDKGRLGCPEFKDDSENIEALNCNADTRNLYRRCLQMCPADPRPDQKYNQ